MAKTVVIEGPIGAGKSTMLQILAGELGKEHYVNTVQEPVEVWKKDGALKEFYADPKGQAFDFQVFAWATRAIALNDAYEANPNAEIHIIERSPFSDRYVFTEMHHKAGNITDSQYRKYLTWWNAWRKIWPVKPTHFIFVNPPLDECMLRVRGRDRDGEEAVDESYQQSLIEQHRILFRDHLSEYPVLHIDDSKDYREPGPARDELLAKVRAFLKL